MIRFQILTTGQPLRCEHELIDIGIDHFIFLFLER